MQRGGLGREGIVGSRWAVKFQSIKGRAYSSTISFKPWQNRL